MHLSKKNNFDGEGKDASRVALLVGVLSKDEVDHASGRHRGFIKRETVGHRRDRPSAQDSKITPGNVPAPITSTSGFKPDPELS